MIYGKTNGGGFGLLPGDKLLFSEFGGETPKGKPIVDKTSLKDMLLTKNFLYIRYDSRHDQTYKISRTSGTVTEHSHLPSGEYEAKENVFYEGAMENIGAGVRYFSVTKKDFEGNTIWKKNLLKFDISYQEGHPKYWAKLRVVGGKFFVAFGEERATNYPNSNIFIREYDAAFNEVLTEVDTGIRVQDAALVDFLASKYFVCLSYLYEEGISEKTFRRITFSTGTLSKVGYTDTSYDRFYVEQIFAFRGLEDKIVYFERKRKVESIQYGLLSTREILSDGSEISADIKDISGNSRGRFMHLSSSKRLRYLNSDNREVFRLGDDSAQSVAVFTFPAGDKQYGNLINISLTGISQYNLMSTIPEFDLTPWQNR